MCRFRRLLEKRLLNFRGGAVGESGLVNAPRMHYLSFSRRIGSFACPLDVRRILVVVRGGRWITKLFSETYSAACMLFDRVRWMFGTARCKLLILRGKYVLWIVYTLTQRSGY
jgi:hypothetical protein